MIPTPPVCPPAVERIDDVVALTYSGLIVSDRHVASDEGAQSFDERGFDEQFSVEWQVPEAH